MYRLTVARVNPFTKQFQVCTTPGKKKIENIVEKGENAGNQNVFLSI